MVFIETSVFSRHVQALLTEAEYFAVQDALLQNPKAGDVIEGTGGLRKLRAAAQGKGKRGGARVIYYFVDQAMQVRLLLVYPKNAMDDLTAAQKKQLRVLIEEWT